jgi:hypothetical protein
VSANERPERRPGLIELRRSADRQTASFRRANLNQCGAWRERAKNVAANARNLRASRATSPGPPNRRTGDPAHMDAGRPAAPVLKARSLTRASALHNRKINRQRTGAERRTRLSAMAASVIRTTARRRSASWSRPSAAFQCITASAHEYDVDYTRHMSMSRTIF